MISTIFTTAKVFSLLPICCRQRRSPSKTWPQGYKTFFMLNSTEQFFLLINVKMPTIIDILTFMSEKNSILGLSEPKKAEVIYIFILMSIYNFMLNSVEHEKSFITSGAGNSLRKDLLWGKFFPLGADPHRSTVGVKLKMAK